MAEKIDPWMLTKIILEGQIKWKESLSSKCKESKTDINSVKCHKSKENLILKSKEKGG